ncbi:MAG: VanZ family protein [Myxococcota bacterium]|nr:VanZ family protein [Myxococcota bacterium]MDW8361431.1 VanZ family protein [Myxococcales bacterium]
MSRTNTNPTGPSRALLGWAPALACMALIWVLSSMSMPPLVPSGGPWTDKLLHAVEYTVLGVLTAHGSSATWPGAARWRLAIFGTAVATGWGLLDELHQAFVPGRMSDWRDLAADAVGASVGATTRILLGARLARGPARVQGVQRS